MQTLLENNFENVELTEKSVSGKEIRDIKFTIQEISQKICDWLWRQS